SDRFRPVLYLGEAGKTSRAHSIAQQRTRVQETRSYRADEPADPTPPGSGGRTDPGEPASQKGVLAVGSQPRHSSSDKERLLGSIAQAAAHTGWTTRCLLAELHLAPATFYRWQQRAQKQQLADRGVLPDRAVLLPTPQEVEAVCAFARAHP